MHPARGGILCRGTDAALKMPAWAPLLRRDLLTRGEFCISGFTNRNLREHLRESSSQITRLLKRLRVHGLIKKVAGRHKYYLTQFGRQVVKMVLKLREMYVIPDFAYGV
jgi:hypothetical protein